MYADAPFGQATFLSRLRRYLSPQYQFKRSLFADLAKGICLLFSAAYNCGCLEPSQEPHSALSGYFDQAVGNTGVIVFVHGVIGGVPGTWTNSGTKAYWPALLKEDNTFKGFDIYTYDFESPHLGKALSIDELAEDLRLELSAIPNQVLAHEEIVFICHSMGGLVVRSFLQKYQPIARKVKMIYFFSTPTEGSEIAKVAELFSRNPQLGKMVQIGNTDYLADQMRAWQAAQFPIASYCAYETKPTFGIEVVSMRSSAALCNRPLTPLPFNHIEMVKPADGQHAKAFKAFKIAFAETRSVISVELPSWSLTLGQALELAAKISNAKLLTSGCDAGFLKTKVAGGLIQGASSGALLEQVLGQVESSKVNSKVIFHREARVYEIGCN